MSRASVKREFVDPLLRSVGNNKLVREAIEAQRGQLLVLEGAEALRKTLKATLGMDRVPAKVLKNALEAGRKQALQLHNRYTSTALGKRRFNILLRRYKEIPHINKYTIGKELFLVSNFNSSINSVKRVMLLSVQKDLDLTEAQRKQVSPELQKGHGESGLAVSQVQAAKGIQRIANLGERIDTDLLFDNLDYFISKVDTLPEADKLTLLNQIDELKVQYQNVVTKRGELRSDYFSIVSLQYSGDNQYDRILEQSLLTVFRKFVEEEFAQKSVLIEGSSSIKDKVSSLVLNNMSEGKYVKAVGDTLSFKEKSTGTAKGKGGKAPKIKATKTRGSLREAPRRVDGATIASQPLNLIALINQKLPAAVRGNMGEPALVNRTGRFADSVRVTDISTTARGYPSIGYTYQLNPYQVFEVGAGRAPWANTNRDPRLLIDRTIREIAAEFAIGRFYTRRTS